MGGFGKETQEERIICIHIAESQVVLMVKNLPANAGNIRVQSLGQKNPLEEEMATHSSIFAWRIPWTEAPSRL